jgi:hypothetical protein
MHRRILIVTGLLLVLALPLAASQFMEMTFDQVARESQLIARGTVVDTFSAWDDAHEVIYTYATLRVHRYFGESAGPDTVTIREVGGTVDGYTQEAIGFPAIRRGENVVFMLSRWDDSTDYRIHAFNQGKYLVRNRGGVEYLFADSKQQGSERLDGERRMQTDGIDDAAPGLSMNEFAQMVDDARAGVRGGLGRTQH